MYRTEWTFSKDFYILYTVGYRFTAFGSVRKRREGKGREGKYYFNMDVVLLCPALTQVNPVAIMSNDSQEPDFA